MTLLRIMAVCECYIALLIGCSISSHCTSDRLHTKEFVTVVALVTSNDTRKQQAFLHGVAPTSKAAFREAVRIDLTVRAFDPELQRRPAGIPDTSAHLDRPGVREWASTEKWE